MKRVILAAVAMALAAVSCNCTAATLRAQATAPAFDNDSPSCASPVLVARAAQDTVWMHFQWTGPAAGEDSIRAVSGQLVVFQRNTPAGVYNLRAWATDAGGIGCDTTITIRAKAAPWRPKL